MSGELGAEKYAGQLRALLAQAGEPPEQLERCLRQLRELAVDGRRNP